MLALLLDLMGLPQASTVAKGVDQLFDFLTVFSVLSFVGVIGALVYFIVRYNRKRSHPDKTPYIEGHPLLEAVVMVGLFVVVMVVFYWGWIDYKKMRQVPGNAMEVNVTGRQWMWEFEYQNGRKMLNEVVVPKGKAVKFILNSPDVLHSFFVPDFRMKQDLVPGMYTYLSFNATQTGEHQVFCAEYCGTSHSGMLAKLKVVEPEEYEKWQKTWEWEKQLGVESGAASEKAPAAGEKPAANAEQKAAAPASGESSIEKGKKLYSEKGCNACHTVTGAALVGPSFKGVFGHEVELEGGKKVTADENYLRQSILDPQSQLVKGFQPVMPTFKGTLSEDEINSLVAYIKSLGS
ncbi:MAG: cytochrome c oxidase subunit II [bacterium]